MIKQEDPIFQLIEDLDEIHYELKVKIHMQRLMYKDIEESIAFIREKMTTQDEIKVEQQDAIQNIQQENKLKLEEKEQQQQNQQVSQSQQEQIIDQNKKQIRTSSPQVKQKQEIIQHDDSSIIPLSILSKIKSQSNMPIKPQSKAGSKVKAQNTKIRQRSPSRAQHNPIGRRGMSLSPRRYNQLPPIQSELQINSKQQQLLPQKAQQQPLNQAITPVKQMQPSQSSQLQQKATSLSQLQPKQLTKEVRLANQIRFVQLLKKMHDHQRQQIERSEYEKKEISKRLNEIEQYSDEGKEQMEKQGNDSNTDQSYNIQIKQGMIGRSRSKTPKSLIRRPEFRVDLSDNSSEDRAQSVWNIHKNRQPWIGGSNEQQSDVINEEYDYEEDEVNNNNLQLKKNNGNIIGKSLFPIKQVTNINPQFLINQSQHSSSQLLSNVSHIESLPQRFPPHLQVNILADAVFQSAQSVESILNEASKLLDTQNYQPTNKRTLNSKRPTSRSRNQDKQMNNDIINGQDEQDDVTQQFNKIRLIQLQRMMDNMPEAKHLYSRLTGQIKKDLVQAQHIAEYTASILRLKLRYKQQQQQQDETTQQTNTNSTSQLKSQNQISSQNIHSNDYQNYNNLIWLPEKFWNVNTMLKDKSLKQSMEQIRQQVLDLSNSFPDAYFNTHIYHRVYINTSNTMKHRSPSPKLQSPSSSVIGSDRWMLTQASNDIHLIQQNMYRQYIDQYIMNKFKPTLSQLYPLQSDIHDETEKDEGNPHEAWSLPLLRFVCNVVGNKGNSFAFVLKDMDSI